MLKKGPSMALNEFDSSIDENEATGGGGGENQNKSRGRSRRELPAHAVTILKAWLVSPEHFHHPYPTLQDQAQLMAETGIDKKQLKNWFTNARRRIWKPLVKHKLQASDGVEDDELMERADGDRASNLSMASRRSTTSSFLDLLATAVDGDSTNSFSIQSQQGASRRPPHHNGAAAAAEDPNRPVPVSPTTVCSFCLRDRVDTQLMPCKHVFHGCCLRPWLEATVTTPCCPVCSVAISNCVLADTQQHQQQQQQDIGGAAPAQPLQQQQQQQTPAAVAAR